MYSDSNTVVISAEDICNMPYLRDLCLQIVVILFTDFSTKMSLSIISYTGDFKPIRVHLYYPLTYF